MIKNNHSTTIQNLGLTRNEFTGHMHIVFTVDFPETLTNTQIESIKNIL